MLILLPLAGVATSRDPAGNYSTASSVSTTAVRGIGAVAHVLFPAPRPQDGTLDFSIAPALPAAVAAHADSAGNSSIAASFNAAVRGSDTAVRKTIPAPRPQGGTLGFRFAPLFPAAVATHAASAENSRADANFNTAVRGNDAFNRPSSTGDAGKPTTLAILIVHVFTVTSAILSRHLLGSRLAPQALVALAEWRAMPDH